MRRPRWSLVSPPPGGLLIVAAALLSCVTPVLSARLVTLAYIEIFTTHEFLPTKPTVYFQCQGENRTMLPDVTEVNITYRFKGEESFQPLTELSDKKCKRCGIYERDNFKSDDVYDEWEMCPSEFTDGIYTHFRESEFNATFLCQECKTSDGHVEVTQPNPQAPKDKSTGTVIVVVMVSTLATILAVFGFYSAYKFWQKKKRQRDQARFLKLFEEGDELDDELGLGPI